METFFDSGQQNSGIYKINPFVSDNTFVIDVSCKMDNCGRKWTGIQNRRSGRVSFNRVWDDYKKGFGNLEDSYWIGNEMLHQLTKGRNSSVYVSITLKNGKTLYEYYDQFSVWDEKDNYTLFLRGPSAGTLGDSMLHSHRDIDLNGMAFSTRDRDNDICSSHCASGFGGGWWFSCCRRAFLNGPLYPIHWSLPWYPKINNGKDIKETLMMIN